ncbi:GFA family protein [Chelatococcus reniformis]|nr:hypothetical protein [Chelatococcus reniformis]
MTAITCACGTVRLEAEGAPMLCAVCHCSSCRIAGQEFDARTDLEPIVDASGGTSAVLWRKDRVRCVAGCERLEPHRLTLGSPTRRMVASCCGAPMFLDFTKGFWLTVYRGRVEHAPSPSIRVMTGDVPVGVVLPEDGLPRVRGHSGRFMLKMLMTRLGMGLRSPRVTGVAD